MSRETFLVPVPPRQLRQLAGWDVLPAHLAYRVGRGPHLFRAGGSPPVQGGIMAVDSQGYDGLGEPEGLCQEVVRECMARKFSGALLDFDRKLPVLEQIAARLDETFARRGWTLYLPELYGPGAGRAKVLIPSALSGGSLALRLEEAVERFGADRVALALEKTAEDFLLPSPTGSGVPLSREELERRLEELHPSVFFSSELCARYFTYMSRENSVHFVLFDDSGTLRRKVDVARRAGIRTFVLPWPLLRDCGGELGLERRQRG